MRICTECGNEIKERGQNIICRKCRELIYAEFHKDEPKEETLDYIPVYPLKRKETQLDRDCKAAKEAGMSYGYYMASKNRRRHI